MPQTTPETSLTFHWRRQAVPRARGLGFWLFVVLLGLAGFFYLFQVVYPQTQRVAPVPQHVVALNAADPAARGVLNKVQDVDFLILPAASEAVGSASLDEHSPVFHSTFEAHKLQLQDLPHRTLPMPPARLLQMNSPMLPPLDLGGIKPAAAGVTPLVSSARLTMRLTGSLALRAMTHRPDLSGIALSDPSACRFQVGVNSDGAVDVALPLASTESPETVRQLTSALRGMRFAAAGAKDSRLVWGTAVFEWSGAAP